jgi:hypothetical protein
MTREEVPANVEEPVGRARNTDALASGATTVGT